MALTSLGKPTKATGKQREPLTLDSAGGLPTPHRPRHIKLRTIDDCRREAEKVHRDMRNGRIEPQTGTRLAYVLSQIAEMIEAHELEQRLAVLEEREKQWDLSTD
jgi:hypothetical protein